LDIEIEYLPLSEIVEADSNPKDHDIGQIYQSIKRFGFTQPIMMNENTGKLLAGHGRLQTLQQMKQAGEKTPNRIKEKDDEWLVPVLKGISFEDDMEAQAYLIADNRLTELGGWNTGELVETLQDLIEGGLDLDGVGYDFDDLESMVNQIDDTGIFDVDVIPDADDEETSVKIVVGRYRFSIEPENFYTWEEKISEMLGSRDSDEFVEWIQEALGFK
tara:strand:- start:1244 stop:1894 length:651 start_codon:yes stop_codon:yes gene_type:complete